LNGIFPSPAHAAALRASVLVALCAACPAWADLGGGVADIQGEQLRMHATRSVATTLQPGSVHELRLADGSSVRQFVNAQGVVYAITWSTRAKPNFAQWLGRHATDFDAAAAAAPRTPGIKRSAFVDQGDLVVQSGGRLGAFVGKAWLKSQMPAGSDANAIR
jgi:hypothetical protein